jgi:predicted metallo-beta-lactamase superfamily hydrolase
LTFYQGAVDCPHTEVLMLEKEPLDCVAARRMIRKILSSEEGQIVFSHHALKESR